NRTTYAAGRLLPPEAAYDQAARGESLKPGKVGGSGLLAAEAGGVGAARWARSIPGAVTQTPTRAANARLRPCTLIPWPPSGLGPVPPPWTTAVMSFIRPPPARVRGVQRRGRRSR